jgi:hypothetical protein
MNANPVLRIAIGLKVPRTRGLPVIPDSEGSVVLGFMRAFMTRNHFSAFAW